MGWIFITMKVSAVTVSQFPEEQYKQWREDFRQLNGLFWRIPILASTGIGGLWFGVATIKLSFFARTGLLSFAVMYCCVMIIVIWRLRMRVMKSILTWLDEVEGREPRHSNHIVASLFIFLMATAGLGTFIAIFNQDTLFNKPVAQKNVVKYERTICFIRDSSIECDSF